MTTPGCVVMPTSLLCCGRVLELKIALIEEVLATCSLTKAGEILKCTFFAAY